MRDLIRQDSCLTGVSWGKYDGMCKANAKVAPTVSLARLQKFWSPLWGIQFRPMRETSPQNATIETIQV